MDPQQVVRDENGVMRCRECGFVYALNPAEIDSAAGAGLDAVKLATAGVAERYRSVRPEPGVWSVNAYVAHLADAAGVILERIRAIASKDRPPLENHDQDRAVEESRADELLADQSLERLSDTVEAFQQTIRALPASAWDRAGIHSLAGEVRLREIAHDMPHELRHHAGDIERIGKRVVSSQ